MVENREVGDEMDGICLSGHQFLLISELPVEPSELVLSLLRMSALE